MNYLETQVRVKMSDAKSRIIDAACQLLEQQGFHATSINEIVDRSQSPKGSLYYYFPGGKDQIAAEAIKAAGKKTADRIRENLKDITDLAVGINDFIEMVAEQMEKTGYSAGSPLSVVAVETSTIDGPVNAACKTAYGEMMGAFAGVLSSHGLEAEEGALAAEQIVLTIEGGILLGRTFHSRDPLLRAARQLSRAISEKIKQKNEIKK